MKLEKALEIREENQLLARKSLIDQGIQMFLADSAKTIDELQVKLTDDSLNADDWEIYSID